MRNPFRSRSTTQGKTLSPRDFSNALHQVMKQSLTEQFKREHLLVEQRRFIEKGWEFDYHRYSYEMMSMHIRMINYTIVKNYPTNPNAVYVVRQFLKDIPKEYMAMQFGDDVMAHFQVTKSDQPLFTISKLSAQRYFGADAGLEEILYFSESAKRFDSVLDAFRSEAILKL